MSHKVYKRPAKNVQEYISGTLIYVFTDTGFNGSIYQWQARAAKPFGGGKD